MPFIDDFQPFVTESFGVRIAATVLTALLLWLVWRMFVQSLNKRIEDPDARYFWRQLSGYVSLLIGVFIVMRLWFQGVGSLLIVLSLVAGGLVISNKEPLLSLTAWPVITWRRLFGIGDRVKIGEHAAGDVIDLGMLFFTLAETGPARGSPDVPSDQHTGRVVKLPNHFVYSAAVTNYSRTIDYVWNRLDVPLTPDSDWKEVEALALQAAGDQAAEVSARNQQQLRDTNEAPIYAGTNPSASTAVRDGELVVTVRYLCVPRKRHATETAIWRSFLEASAATDNQVQLNLVQRGEQIQES